MALTFWAAGVARSAATEMGQRLKVAGSISAKRTRAPARRMALAEAKKLNGVVITVSVEVPPASGPRLAAARASQMASVPLAQPMA